MLTRSRPTWELSESAATDEADFLNRRELCKSIAAGSILAGSSSLLGASSAFAATDKDPSAHLYPAKGNGAYTLDRDITPEKIATTYNNFYEFTTDKYLVRHFANQGWKTEPWTLKVGGHVEKELTLDVNALCKEMGIEMRVYRFRCVEAWSMVIPWQGFPLSELIKIADPLSSAKFIQFVTVFRPEEMPGQKKRLLPWPYVEGLRLDEALHPLTIMATGIYGRDIPNQNGAPLRLVVPWKYGFKSIKSIVKITLTDKEPPTSWNIANPREYGFYSNVNPEVDHPRWSQASERPLGGGLFARRIPTLMFNGYAEEVGDLYKGMNLRKFI